MMKSSLKYHSNFVAWPVIPCQLKKSGGHEAVGKDNKLPSKKEINSSC